MVVLLILLALVAVPALIGFVFAEGDHAGWRAIFFRRIGVGDSIVYRRQEVSTRPTLSARDIHPAERGDLYYYFVHRYWMVEDVFADGRIIARTRTNKLHSLLVSDPSLRKASLLERLRFRDRFPQPAE